jgi:Heterokaryon incompatibility protein (HET)
MESLNGFADDLLGCRERMRVLMRPMSNYPVHVPSSSKASLEPSDARGLLQRQGLPVETVTARPLVELYSRCKLADPKDVRLLRLFPAAEWAASAGIEQPLVAQIFSGPLPDFDRTYETISYVWGSEEMPKSIIIFFIEPGTDSKEASMFDCNITENLWQALSNVRSLSRHRDIWADAICINQGDIPEKNTQVAQMRDVYARSKNTLAYLGPRFDGLDALVALRDSYMTQNWFFPRPMAPDHAERGQYMLFRPEQGIVRANQTPHVLISVLLLRVIGFFAIRRTFGLVFSRSLAQTIATGIIARDLRNTLPLMFFKNKFLKFFSREKPEVIFTLDQIVYGMAEFFSRPWFRRVWIIQECVVSRRVRFLVGREEFDIEEVFVMLNRTRELKSTIADFGSAQLISFTRMLMLRRSMGQAAPSLSTFLSWAWSSGFGEEATDPRDRIFALIGLLSEKNPAFIINYTLDTYEIFSRYARVLVQSQDGFMLLEDPRRHGGLDMPSWIPDFAKRNDQIIYGALEYYSCSDGLNFSPYRVESTDKSIEVNAILLAGVNFIGRLYSQPSEELHENFLLFPSKISSLPLMQLLEFFYKTELEPRNDISDIMKDSSIRLPKGMNAETAAEVLMQTGLFLDQTAGSLGPPNKREMYPVEKYPDEKHAQDLIAKTIIAARYARLWSEGSMALETLEDVEQLEMDIEDFFEEYSTGPSQDRSKLFHRLVECSHLYPRMWRHPLFRALSQEDWPPESMKNDESIPEEIYNDDFRLYKHWAWSFSYQSTNNHWAGRRLAKTADGYICSADKDTQIGDRIAIVAGCRMPIILRPRDDGTYQVVGHAYVMGLMHGEVMELGIEPEQILIY